MTDKVIAPTGPSRASANINLPQKPNQAQSMGPPKPLTADEERAAARARRFGSLVSESMPIRGSASPAQSPAQSPRGKQEEAQMAPPSTPGGKKEDEARPKSPPLPPSRKASPGARSRRSGSIESRTSERSRRDHRDRDRGGRDDRRRESRGTTPEAKIDEKTGERDRRKQEDLLQARHDKLAGGEERRSSSSRKDKETDKERADRKAREKEEKAAKEKDEAGQKRKRDELVSCPSRFVNSQLTNSLVGLIRSNDPGTDGVSANEKNLAAEMIAIVIGIETAIAVIEEVTDMMTLAIVMETEGAIHHETGIGATILAAQGGTTRGTEIGIEDPIREIGDQTTGIKDLMIVVDLMIRLGNYFLPVQPVMADLESPTRLARPIQSSRLVRKLLRPRRLQLERPHHCKVRTHLM